MWIHHAQNFIEKLKTYVIDHFDDLNNANPWGNRVYEEIMKVKPIRDEIIRLNIILLKYSKDTHLVASLLKNLLQLSFNEFSHFQE